LEILVKNNSKKLITRSTETFTPNSERVVELEKDSIKFKQIDRCSSLEWEYCDRVDEVGDKDFNSFTSIELKEIAQDVGIKNYSNMLKNELVESLEHYRETGEKELPGEEPEEVPEEEEEKDTEE